MRKFLIKVDGKAYEVEVEEVGGNESSAGTISSTSTSYALPSTLIRNFLILFTLLLFLQY